ncbi:MAG: DUF1847 domain-containing protein [Clostridiales bacterium]
MSNQNKCLSCTDCGVVSCSSGQNAYPEFCLTANLDQQELKEALRLYDDPINRKIAVAAAEVEAAFYCKYTRVQEIIEFAHRIGAKKIGIATCVGLIEESRIFAKILRVNGLEPYGIACKVGATEKKTGLNLDEQYIMKPGERMCNPILQAKLLNKTDLNVVVGLCVGHDSLFYKYSKAICTTLLVKDRVLGHNPVAALYTSKTYYKKLLNQPQNK